MLVRISVLLCVCLSAGSSLSATGNPDKPGATPQSTFYPDTCRFEPVSGDYNFREDNLTLATPGSNIGKIHFTRLPIFNVEDPNENNWLFRWANRFHGLTREETINQQLLFAQGDELDLRTLEESGRLLRDLGYLYDANIRIAGMCGEKTDIEVVTRDVWSLTLDASFSRSGGENDHRLGIAETNLFGLGKNLSVINRKDTDRQVTEFAYRDKNLFGSRVQTVIRYSDGDDGAQKIWRLALPFYALDSRRAWGLILDDNKRIDTQYARGEEVSEVRHNMRNYRFFYGFSNGLVEGIVERFSVGYQYHDATFLPVAAGLPAPAKFPDSKELSYPFFHYQNIEDNYTTAFNFDQIHRTEDLHLGHDLSLSIGYASKVLGSNQERLVFSGEFSDTLAFNESILLQHQFEWYGLYNLDSSKSEDVVLDYNLKYFRSQTSHRSFFARLNGIWTRNLNSNQQIVLGGDTGVRGYDRRFQVGDKRLVLTLEERQYTDYHLLNLAYLGFAAFVDVGRAWKSGVGDGLDSRYLANVGFGIRLASSKADAGRIIHIDFSFPITNRDEPDVDSSQLTINIKNSL